MATTPRHSSGGRRPDEGLRVFTVQLVLLAVLFTAVTYGAIYVRTRNLLYDSLRDQAVASDHVESQLEANAFTLALLGALSAIAASTSIIYMTARLGSKIDEASEKLQRAAVTDELTDLLNRRGVLERLESELARAHRARAPLSVIMLDLDRFKLVNDRYGHLTGDEVLRAVSAGMSDEVRAYDIVGRMGGEEILVIAPGTDMESALALAERIRVRIGSLKIERAGVAVSVTVSGGVAQMHEGEDLDGVLARADVALYEAKQNGRNRITRARG